MRELKIAVFAAIIVACPETASAQWWKPASVSTETRIVAHPAGCPRRLFCGCGVSVRVFGRPIRHFYLARNWMAYPKTSPKTGAVAANRRHVMFIEHYLGGNRAIVYDPNSGGRKTRIHVRDLRGYKIVNPTAGAHKKYVNLRN